MKVLLGSGRAFLECYGELPRLPIARDGDTDLIASLVLGELGAQLIETGDRLVVDGGYHVADLDAALRGWAAIYDLGDQYAALHCQPLRLRDVGRELLAANAEPDGGKLRAAFELWQQSLGRVVRSR